MSSRPDPVAERRKALIARCDRDRDELGAIFGGIQRRLGVAEAVVAAARGLQRNRALIGAAGVAVLFAPAAARTWLRGAVWLLPAVIEGYRRVGAHRRKAGDDPAARTDAAR